MGKSGQTDGKGGTFPPLGSNKEQDHKQYCFSLLSNITRQFYGIVIAFLCTDVKNNLGISSTHSGKTDSFMNKNNA